MKNDFNYKWSKLFASKRYNTKNGVIKLTPEEQQELLDDSERVVKNCSIPDLSGTTRDDLVDIWRNYSSELFSKRMFKGETHPITQDESFEIMMKILDSYR